MEIVGLGPVTLDADFGDYVSRSLPVPVFGHAPCRFVVVGYDDDEAKVDFEAAISAFLGLGESALRSASVPVFQYYLDVKAEVGGDEGLVSIAGPDDVWSHVRPGGEVTVQRDAHGDRQVYVSAECECAWEPEHGLQIVFRGGCSVTKVGPFDSHLTNVSAFGRADLADVVYHRFG
ncbi:DUF6985 domain-containing protein [Actinacidiphila rubida]|uniref:DUF6985 domain-containing protein n=1 Tax=Actinacidiphila rubida TaxID=310780 RepID=A0A1H8MWK2_9ACTN|nr:hypothetical protein [Actinacidiphila rubida]SEO21628.1 hypothetical protein SAMN05216267_102038 [Actinacidiphila rubida]